MAVVGRAALVLIAVFFKERMAVQKEAAKVAMMGG
jgi:hypothetical protein